MIIIIIMMIFSVTRGSGREAAIICNSKVFNLIRFPFLYFALAFSHKSDRFSLSMPRIRAENFRFYTFWEI